MVALLFASPRIGSKNPELVRKERLSKAQNPIRPRSLSVPPISFHAGVGGDSGFFASVEVDVASLSCLYDPNDVEDCDGYGRYICRPISLTVLGGGGGCDLLDDDGVSSSIAVVVVVVDGPHPILLDILEGRIGLPGLETTFLFFSDGGGSSVVAASSFFSSTVALFLHHSKCHHHYHYHHVPLFLPHPPPELGVYCIIFYLPNVVGGECHPPMA
jgi:hypothetical protein